MKMRAYVDEATPNSMMSSGSNAVTDSTKNFPMTSLKPSSAPTDMKAHTAETDGKTHSPSQFNSTGDIKWSSIIPLELKK